MKTFAASSLHERTIGKALNIWMKNQDSSTSQLPGGEGSVTPPGETLSTKEEEPRSPFPLIPLLILWGSFI